MKAKEVGTLHAKTHFSELLKAVERGQSFLITRHGKRIAELSPFKAATKKPRFGFAKGTFTRVAEDFDAPLEDFKDYLK